MQEQEQGQEQEQDQVFPNLVVAGFQKCGTSSLFEWLCLHPAVCGSTVKETHYLDDQPRAGAANYRDGGLKGYGQFFHPGPAHRIIMEATPSYVLQQTPLEVLADLPSEPRLLFVLREPSQRILSQFRYFKYNLGLLSADTTLDAWLQTAPGQQNIKSSHYHAQLTRWLARIPRERIRVQLFEDLVRQPRKELAQLAAWLGLDGGVFAEQALAARNRTQQIRYPRLHRLAQRCRGWVPGKLADRLLPAYYALVARAVAAPTGQELEQAAALANQFREERDALARDFSLDLSAWEPANSAPHPGAGTPSPQPARKTS